MITHFKDSILYVLLFIFIFFAGFSDAAERPFKLGVTGGQTRIKNSTTQQYQEATHVGVTAAVNVMNTPSLIAGAEGKYTKTTSREDVTDIINSTTTQYEEEVKALYLTAKNKGPVYLKAKIGAANRIVKTDNTVLIDTIKTATGIGLGIETNRGGVMELEYTQYDNDTSVVSVGYLF